MATCLARFSTNVDHLLECNLKRRRRRRTFKSINENDEERKLCQSGDKMNCLVSNDHFVAGIQSRINSKQANDLISVNDNIHNLSPVTSTTTDSTLTLASKMQFKRNKQVILAQSRREKSIHRLFCFRPVYHKNEDQQKTTALMNNISLLISTIFLILCCQSITFTSCQTNVNELLLQPPEARTEINRLQQAHGQPANSIDLNQLVNLFNSIQNQQRQRSNNNNNNNGNPSPINNNNVQPLPLGAMGGQRGGGLATFAAAANFQPTRRQQQHQFNSSPAPQLFNNNPALTPNRLNSLANNNQQRPQQQFGNNNNLNINNGQLPQPINTIPLGQPRPPMGQINRAQSGSNLSSRNPLVPPPINRLASSVNQVRPITGFAPSGPPPNLASNNAINVVQSPSNAIGTIASPQQPAITTTTTAATLNGNGEQVTLTRATTPTTNLASSSPTPTSTPQTTTQAEQKTTTGVLISTSENSPVSSSSEQPQLSSTPKNGNEIGLTQQQQQQQTAGSNWNPVQQGNANKTQQHDGNAGMNLAPSPDIVTVPPDYDLNKQQPAVYDIPVSAQMGGPISPAKSAAQSPNAIDQENNRSNSISIATIAPTAVTTIIWSPPPSSPPAESMSSSSSRFEPTRIQIQPTRVVEPQPVASSTTQVSTPQSTLTPTITSSAPPTRIRDSSSLNTISNNIEAQTNESDPASNGVVYGKSDSNGAKPTGPTPSPPDSDRVAGRPFIQSAPLDSQVKPYTSSSQSSRQHSGSHTSLPFKPSKPLNSGGGNVVGSGFTIVANGNQTMPERDIQDYVAGQPPPIVSANSGNQEPTISAHGGPDPFELPMAESSHRESQHPASSTTAPSMLKVRRPTFKPKPAVPPIRIDSCIVGDDSSCDQSHNERCVTEYGISSCHCRPGFARLSQLRGYCSPVVSLQFSMKIDKLSDDRKLTFNHTLENPNSEEYQYLEFETLQAISSGILQTAFSKQYMGARVNKFLERKSKIWTNVSIYLELNNVTKNEQNIQKIMAQELTRLQRLRQPLGDSTIVLDAAYRESASATPLPAFSKIQDLNECASKDLNDCSKHATCTNEFGGFSCQCLAGYEDKYQAQFLADQANGNSSAGAQLDKNKLGRICMGCSPAYCSNRGDCSVVEGKKQCKCRANFMGARCDIDSEVLAVAIGGSLVGLIILVVTFWCLFVFNRRWRREQQKMDAMSATSGLTNYNYASNSANSTNSLMSPSAAHAAAAAAAAQQSARSMGRSSAAAAAANFVGQRFVGGLMGRSAASGHINHHHQHLQHHYALEQQAMLAGSGTSSGSSSAASQPLACNPYQGYAYDDGLLIAPISTGSSEQTSPSGNSYRGIIPESSNTNHTALMAAGSAYTLSGHHHHHHHLQQQQQQQLFHQLHHMNHDQNKHPSFSQFHPMDQQQYARTLTNNGQQNGYGSRWRTLQGQQQENKANGTLAGYYLVR